MEVCAVLKLDNCYVGQTSWKPLGTECWSQQLHIELDKVQITCFNIMVQGFQLPVKATTSAVLCNRSCALFMEGANFMFESKAVQKKKKKQAHEQRHNEHLHIPQ